MSKKVWSQKKKYIVNSVLNFRRVTHFWLCMLETQVVTTVFRCLSRFVVGSSLATKMSVFGGKVVPSVHNYWVKIVRLKNKLSLGYYAMNLLFLWRLHEGSARNSLLEFFFGCHKVKLESYLKTCSVQRCSQAQSRKYSGKTCFVEK